MTIVLNEFVLDVPRATAIWSVLLILALTVPTVLVVRPYREDPPVEESVPPAEVLADLRRYVDEVAVAAAGAVRNAGRRREAWLAAQEEVERSWAGYDLAALAARRFVGAGALPEPRTPRTPAEYAARQRWLHHAAMAAHWRGDLSARQLSDVFGHRHGWSPRRHPVQQEALLARAVRDGKLAAYRAAAEREQVAWREVEVAAESVRALRAEAYAAAARLCPDRPATLRPAVPWPLPHARWRPVRAG